MLTFPLKVKGFLMTRNDWSLVWVSKGQSKVEMEEYETLQTETEREPKDLVDVEMRKLALALEELGRVRVEKRRQLEKHYDEMLAALVREKVVKMEEMEQEAREKQEKLEREANVMLVDALNLENGAEDRELHPQEDLEKDGDEVLMEHSAIVEAFLKEVDEEADEDEIVDEDLDEKARPLFEAPICPVCFEPMSPPARIFQCGGGHLLCGRCRPRIQVGSFRVFCILDYCLFSCSVY